MPLPTLLVKGKLQAPNSDPKLQKELDDWVPIDYVVNWIKSRLSLSGIKNRVIVLKAETASGKSTVIPAEIYRQLVRPLGTSAAGIICTQPRRLTAVRNVTQMIWHSGADYPQFLILGETIGWSTRYNKLKPQSYGILSATVGTLKQLLSVVSDDQLMRTYRYIMIDETHERDLETDLTLYMLRNFLLRNEGNPHCPFVLLMSATFEPFKFIEYYKCDHVNNFVWCEGRSVGIDYHWDWNMNRVVNNYPQAAAQVVEMIIKENADDEAELCDILIFMPGKSEINQTAEWLDVVNEKLEKAGKEIFNVLKIDSESQKIESMDFRLLDIPLSEQHVFVNKNIHKPFRRVIISTNFAETGITIGSLKYVIDSGYNKEVEYNPNYGIHALIVRPAPRSRITQRMGRVGRIFKGHFYPLYPQHIYKALPTIQLPQILINDISPIMLDIINIQLENKKIAGDFDPEFNIADISMIDMPTADAIHAALEKLYALGFIAPFSPRYERDPKEIIDMNVDLSKQKFGITRLGALASLFSIMSPECIRMIFSAYSWECSILDIITIAAYVSDVTRRFIASTKKGGINWVDIYKNGAPGYLQGPAELYKVRLLIADEFIDGIFLYNAIKQVIAQTETKEAINVLRKWCYRNNISYDAVIGFIGERDNIIDQMLIAGMDILLGENNSMLNSKPDTLIDTITRIKYCIYEGYRLNMIIKKDPHYYTSNGMRVLSPQLFKEDEHALMESGEYNFAINITPKLMIYRELNVKYNKKKDIYDILVDSVSVLDGYVNPDDKFLL